MQGSGTLEELARGWWVEKMPNLFLLRELGETPEPKHAFQVLGAIIETPMSGAYDTLAA
jgi:hypothetical protein